MFWRLQAKDGATLIASLLARSFGSPLYFHNISRGDADSIRHRRMKCSLDDDLFLFLLLTFSQDACKLSISLRHLLTLRSRSVSSSQSMGANTSSAMLDSQASVLSDTWCLGKTTHQSSEHDPKTRNCISGHPKLRPSSSIAKQNKAKLNSTRCPGQDNPIRKVLDNRLHIYCLALQELLQTPSH